jgi:ferric-dicitrate binding protein FerR (iron transport regulator)
VRISLVRFFICGALICGGPLTEKGLQALGKENTQPSKVEDFPAGVLAIRGEVQLEGRFLVVSQRRSSEPFVYSGNTIRVADGEARLELLLGGALNLCRASQLSILQNHSPYLFSLARGSVTFDLPQSRGDTFFTPDFLIRTSGDSSAGPTAFKGEISMDSDGAVCVRSLAGDLRITAQSGSDAMVLLPGASVRLFPGKIGSEVTFLKESCACAKYPKLNNSLMSFQRHSDPYRLLVKTKRFFRKLLHVVTFSLA